MLVRLGRRLLGEVSPRLLWKAGYLWAYKGTRAIRAYRRRVKRGELFPPFLFLALTNACNLRCRGCWIESHGAPDALSLEDVEAVIRSGKRHGSYFYTLLGGEPFLYPQLWTVLQRHPECYFQLITNGHFLEGENCQRLRKLGNVTVLVSIDGEGETNDARRGAGAFRRSIAGLKALQEAKLLFGVATTITAANCEEVLADEYVQAMIDHGAMYLWYYVFRPVGADPSPELSVDRDQMLAIRRRLLELRRRHPIIIIDTYWDAEGRAVCPAALGLGFHIGPTGTIEPCPPLSFACETVRDNAGDLFVTIDGSRLLRGFQEFARERTCGCVILENPGELADFLESHEATDVSGRDAFGELRAGSPRSSHYLPGEEISEDFWFYRLLKRQLFFGMGGYA